MSSAKPSAAVCYVVQVRHRADAFLMLFTHLTTRRSPCINPGPSTSTQDPHFASSLWFCLFTCNIHVVSFYFLFRKFNHICEQTRFKSWRSKAVCFSLQVTAWSKHMSPMCVWETHNLIWLCSVFFLLCKNPMQKKTPIKIHWVSSLTQGCVKYCYAHYHYKV